MPASPQRPSPSLGTMDMSCGAMTQRSGARLSRSKWLLTRAATSSSATTPAAMTAWSWSAGVVAECRTSDRFPRLAATLRFERLAPMFQRHGVQVWLAEAGGPIEVGSPLHQALMTVLGAQSQREVLRARHRTLAAMRAQVTGQGRYLGGRPPYGYRWSTRGRIRIVRTPPGGIDCCGWRLI